MTDCVCGFVFSVEKNIYTVHCTCTVYYSVNALVMTSILGKPDVVGTCTRVLGNIRCATVSPDAAWIAMGYSTGVVTMLDIRTGLITASWKAHEGEILQVPVSTT